MLPSSSHLAVNVQRKFALITGIHFPVIKFGVNDLIEAAEFG